MTPEWIAKAKGAKTAEALLALAEENRYPMDAAAKRSGIPAPNATPKVGFSAERAAMRTQDREALTRSIITVLPVITIGKREAGRIPSKFDDRSGCCFCRKPCTHRGRIVL